MATLDAVLDALGDPTRRALVDRLADGPAPVARIAAELPISRPAVSQHLRVLLDAGLVAFERQGRSNLYRLEPDGFGELRRWLDRFWDDVLGRFEAHAHEQHRGEQHRGGPP